MCARMTAFDHLDVSGHYGMSKGPRDCYALHQSCRQPIDEIITKKQNLTNWTYFKLLFWKFSSVQEQEMSFAH